MTESSLCFPQENSDAKWAIEVMLSVSVATLNFTDFHDTFCEACGNAGLIREYLELLEQLKKCTPEFEDQTVGVLLTSPYNFNSFTPRILLLILLTDCHTIFML